MVEQAEVSAPETKECPTCMKQIESAKLRLHEVRCARNNYKCAKCGEVVAKEDKDDHDEEFHSDKPDIVCDLCNEYKSKDKLAVATHKKADCPNRPQAVAANSVPVPVMAAQEQSSFSELAKCPHCPMEFTQDEIANHSAYCGSKTKECPECFSTVQAWMMNQHKESGQCANVVLDRAEEADQNQMRQAMSMSQSNNPALDTGLAVPAQQPVAFAQPDDGMDENERLIAKLMQEEANAIDGGSAMQQQPMNQNNPDSMQDDGGVRQADDQRMQCLNGPDPDDDPRTYNAVIAEERRLRQEAINQRIIGDIGSGFQNAFTSVASGIGSMFGFSQAQPAVQQPVNQGDNDTGLSEEEKQMQLAMAASMNMDAPAQENPSQVQGVPQQNAGDNDNMNMTEDEQMARAMAASMSAERSSLDQIRERNDAYQQQMAQGFEDEDAMLARVMAESQNQM